MNRHALLRLGASVGLTWGIIAPLSAQTLPATEAPAGSEVIADTGDVPGEPSVKPTTRTSRFSRPAEREIQFQEGVMQYSRGSLAAAEKNFRGVVTDDPADAEGYYYLGLAQLDQNKAKDAVESLDQSLRLDPTFDEVRAARASALIRLKRLDEAEEDIKVLEADPRWDGLVHNLRGHLYYNQGKLDKAEEEFRLVERSGQTEAASARLYAGLTYYKMKNYSQARRSFRDASGADAGLSDAAGEELDTSVGIRARRLDARISLGYEYDSNVIQVGTDSRLPVGITGEADQAFVAQPSLGYTFVRQGKFEAILESSGYFSWHEELTDFDIASYQVGPYVSYTPSPKTKLDIRYGYNDLDLGNDPFVTRHIVTPGFWSFQKGGYTRLYYQYQSLEYEQPVILEPFNRDGDLHRLGITQVFYLPALLKEADKSYLDLTYRFDHQSTDGNDFEGNFHTAQLVYYVPLPWWNLRADVGGSLSYRGYSNRNSIENNPLVIEAADDRREDWEYRGTAGITKKFNEWLSFRVDYAYTENNSNIDTVSGSKPYDFDRHVVGARLILTY